MCKYVYECKQCNKLETIESSLGEPFFVQEGLCMKCRDKNLEESYRKLYEIVERLRIEDEQVCSECRFDKDSKCADEILRQLFGEEKLVD